MKHFIFVAILVILVSAVLAEEPPSLDFHQFYGKVANLPAGTYTLRATVGTERYETPIAADGKYGYSPTFKVYASPGENIAFSIVQTSTSLGTAAYQSLGVTEKNFDYSSGGRSAGESSGTGSQANVTTTEDENGLSTREQRRGQDDDNESEPAVPVGACMYSWICNGWSPCQNGIQTRSCIRDDQCEQKLARREATSIITLPKPREQQTCAAVEPAMPGMLCSPNAKRCFGLQLQQCSADGQGWNRLQMCSSACDPLTFACREGTLPEEREPEPVFPKWILPLVGSLVLLVVIAIVVVMILRQQKKYGPAKEYITEEREKGVSDAQIRNKLVNTGWDSEKIDKLLK